MGRPRCEQKGTVRHAATCVLIWELTSGRIAKFYCDEHSKDASPQPYYVSKLIGYCQRAKGVTEAD